MIKTKERINFRIARKITWGKRLRIWYQSHVKALTDLIQWIIGGFKPSNAERRIPVVGLTGMTYVLILYSLWFTTQYVNPSNPIERMACLVLGIGMYILVQYVILQANDVANLKKAMDNSMQKERKKKKKW